MIGIHLAALVSSNTLDAQGILLSRFCSRGPIYCSFKDVYGYFGVAVGGSVEVGACYIFAGCDVYVGEGVVSVVQVMGWLVVFNSRICRLIKPSLILAIKMDLSLVPFNNPRLIRCILVLLLLELIYRSTLNCDPIQRSNRSIKAICAKTCSLFKTIFCTWRTNVRKSDASELHISIAVDGCHDSGKNVSGARLCYIHWILKPICIFSRRLSPSTFGRSDAFLCLTSWKVHAMPF